MKSIFHYISKISIFFILLITPQYLVANNIDLKFGKIGIKDGLSQSTISVIFQDSRGFLWFGTQDGLNRFDGYTFTIFKSNPADSNSISDNWRMSISEDSSSNLWIGTAGGGLNKFERKTEDFQHYYADESTDNSISSERILTTYIQIKFYG